MNEFVFLTMVAMETEKKDTFLVIIIMVAERENAPIKTWIL